MRKHRPAIGVLAAALLTATSIGVTPAAPAAAVTPDPCPEALTAANRPVAPPSAASDVATFVDPTVTVVGAEHVRVSHRDYLAPYATLVAPSAAEEISIEEGANVQDNTRLEASGGTLHVGEHAIVAHGAQIVGAGGPASIGHVNACPLPAPGTDPNTMTTATPRERGLQALATALFGAGVTYNCEQVPAFIGFNALNQSHISDGALLGVLSRLPSGVTLHPGLRLLPGQEPRHAGRGGHRRRRPDRLRRALHHCRRHSRVSPARRCRPSRRPSPSSRSSATGGS